MKTTELPRTAEQPAVGAQVQRPVGRPVAVEQDCEDQGFSDVSEGCNKWPCSREPLVKWRLGWRCKKCGGCY